MRRVHETEIGAASGDSAVDLVSDGTVTTSHGGDKGFVADSVTKRNEEAGVIDRFGIGRRLARQDGDQVAAMGLEHLSHSDCVVDLKASFDPVGGGESDRDRLVLWPHRTHRVEYLKGKAHAVLQRS